MRQRLQLALYATLLAGFGLVAGGCEDASKHGVQAHVPALNPANAPVTQVPPTLRELPLRKLSPEWLAALALRVPGPKEYLIAQVEAKFASGEQNYKAGHLDAARRDFDDAVDWLLGSGYDPNSDSKLNELSHESIPIRRRRVSIGGCSHKDASELRWKACSDRRSGLIVIVPTIKKG